MNSIADATVTIQTSSESVPAPPSWPEEVALFVRSRDKQGILDAISSQVRFARRRFGRYKVIDVVAVLFGYAISGEPMLDLFYSHLSPFATPSQRSSDEIPARSMLSRLLAALTAEAIEALHQVY